MPVDHSPNITVNVTLDPSPTQEAGFGTVLLLVDQATNSLNGVRGVTYTSYEDMVTANTAGYINAGSLAAGAVAFAQRPKPAEFKLARVDLAGGETYATGLTAAITFDDDFYGLAINSRTQSIIAAVGLSVESLSKRILFIFQDDDVSWLDAAVPAALSAMEGYERSIACYHTTDAQWMDVGMICNRLVYDPDEKSAPWNGFPVAGITAYTTRPTAAERLLAIANDANLGLAYGGEDFVIDPGNNLNERPIYEMVTRDWFEIRLKERVAAEVVRHANRGDKIVVDKTGQKKLKNIIDGLLAQGVGAGHFVAGQTESVAETITSSDLSNRRLRFTVRAQFAVSARLFTFTCYFSRDPIADDE